MQTLALTIVAALTVIPSSVANAENCTVRAIGDVLRPVASERNFMACQSDSNYTLLSLQTPSSIQTRSFCSSSACQALLHSTLSSDVLPDCDVAVGNHFVNLTDAVATVASKCSEAATERLSLYEREVDSKDGHSKAQRTSGHVASVLGHSAPMDEVGGVGELAGALLSLLRQ
jgi:hypothetical protein